MKNWKKNAAILAGMLFLTALFGSAYAINYNLTYSVTQHTIDILISTDGKDTAIEKIYIDFPDENAKVSFREASTQLATNIDEWKQLNPLFVPSLGDSTQNKKIAYNEGERNYLQISYDLSEPLMAKTKDAEMLTEYGIKVNYFNSFYQSGLWIIPENTSIMIELPPGAEIRDTIEPQADITNNGTRKVVTWQGYKSGNKLTLNYVVWKKMDPVIDLNATTNFLFKTQPGMLLILAIIIVIIAIAWQRKKIGEKIEDFVENHSLITEE